MKDVKLNEKKINTIKSIGGCVNFGGIDVSGKQLFVIKTKKDNSMSAIAVYPDYTKSKRKVYKYSTTMRHGNDLAYNDGFLYVAPCAKYVVRVDLKTMQEEVLQSDVYVSAISHYKGKQFFALTGSGKGFYNYAILTEQSGRMISGKAWQVRNPFEGDGFIVTQGLAYKKTSKQLYQVFAEQTYLKNIILRSGISKEEPNCVFRSRIAKEEKYEFEGIAFLGSGSMLIGANRGTGDKLYTAR